MTNQNPSIWRRLLASLIHLFSTDNLKLLFNKEFIINFLKDKTVKLALKKLLGSAMAGGFKGWLVKFIVTELFEELAEPIIRFSFRKAGYIYNKVEGKILIKKLNEAENEDEYDSIVTDILS